jgi:hypothetical protein
MRLLVCGGRHFTGRIRLWSAIDRIDARDFIRTGLGVECVIHGAANGADQFAGQWAREHKREEVAVPAAWGALEGYAGIIRNQRMLTFKPDLVLAAPGGKGTANMILTAKFRGFKVEDLDGNPL